MVQGADFELPLQLKNPDGSPVDLTDITFEAALRVAPQETALIVDFTITKADDETTGRFFLGLSNAQTSLLTQRNYVWALLMVNALGRKFELVRGKAVVDGVIA